MMHLQPGQSVRVKDDFRVCRLRDRWVGKLVEVVKILPREPHYAGGYAKITDGSEYRLLSLAAFEPVQQDLFE